MDTLPSHFQKMQSRHGNVMKRLHDLSQACDEAGPLEPKTAHLIKLGAAAAQRSEGAVHSHTRRAMEAGASKEEIRQALLLLLPTIGYPTMAAAMSWADDVLGDE
jgi:AhpD family alkylhydroperoxidase